MPAYFMSNFSLCKSNYRQNIENPKLAIIATVLYYLLLIVPVVLLIAWISVIGEGTGANPALPILFTFLFVVSLVIPVPSDFFYLKVLIAFIFFITSQIITMALFWDSQYKFYYLDHLQDFLLYHLFYYQLMDVLCRFHYGCLMVLAGHYLNTLHKQIRIRFVKPSKYGNKSMCHQRLLTEDSITI